MILSAEISWLSAERSYNPAQPRDSHGRWSSGNSEEFKNIGDIWEKSTYLAKNGGEKGKIYQDDNGKYRAHLVYQDIHDDTTTRSIQAEKQIDMNSRFIWTKEDSDHWIILPGQDQTPRPGESQSPPKNSEIRWIH